MCAATTRATACGSGRNVAQISRQLLQDRTLCTYYRRVYDSEGLHGGSVTRTQQTARQTPLHVTTQTGRRNSQPTGTPQPQPSRTIILTIAPSKHKLKPPTPNMQQAPNPTPQTQLSLPTYPPCGTHIATHTDHGDSPALQHLETRMHTCAFAKARTRETGAFALPIASCIQLAATLVAGKFHMRVHALLVELQVEHSYHMMHSCLQN